MEVSLFHSDAKQCKEQRGKPERVENIGEKREEERSGDATE